MTRMWEKMYQEKLTTPEEAVKLIRDGDWVTSGIRQPKYSLRALLNSEDIKDVHFAVGQLHFDTVEEVLEAKNNVQLYSSFLGGVTLELYNQGRINFVPSNFSYMGKVPTFIRNCRVAFATVTPPDENGFVSFGNSFDYIPTALKEAEVVIAEINPQMPFVYSDELVHISVFDKIIETEGYKLNTTYVDEDKSNENYKKIGGYLSELIEDGATLELGIGRLNTAAMEYYDGPRDLGIHTEIFGDALMRLYERGFVTNERKSIHKDKFLCTQVFGSEELYAWVHKNHLINARSSQYCLSPGVICQNYKMTAINNAIEVDLFGQVSADVLKGKQFSGMGGIGDFSTGASLCPNGKSIIVVESATKNLKHSKIVPYIKPGTPISVPRTEVEYVVSEYGIARLAGKPIKKRAKELINIAHPNFRAELTKEAQNLGIF